MSVSGDMLRVPGIEGYEVTRTQVAISGEFNRANSDSRESLSRAFYASL